MNQEALELKDMLRIEGINSKGFGIIPKVVMFDPDLSIEAKTIYAYFCSLAGNGTTAFPNRDTILFYLNITKDYYYKHFNQLKEQEFIKVERNSNFPYNNIYTLINNPKKYEEKMSNFDKNKPYSQLKYSGLKAHGFGIVPRIIMMDRRLHIKAKGIYAYFCSLIGNGITAFPQINEILFYLHIGRQAYYKYYNQLVSCNYITVVQRKTDSGTFSVNDYYLNDNPDYNIGQQRQGEKQENLPCDDLQDNDKCIDNTGFQPCDDLPDNDLPCDDLPDNDLPYDDLPYDDLPDNNNINSININSININKSINQSNDKQKALRKSTKKKMIDKIDKNKKTNKKELPTYQNDYELYKKLIAQNISYEDLKLKFFNENMIGEILNLMTEIVTSDKKYIRVNGEDKPAEIVKSTFLKLNATHIEYVLESIENNTTEINNIKAYMISTLYNAPMTINTYYRSRVNYDLYGSK
ncbi:MAG TPA: DUF6017 domain-containing protein [Clostridiales bacterium]|nr:DUF6017 domain-containing protein [Clostridiales bacterium]